MKVANDKAFNANIPVNKVIRMCRGEIDPAHKLARHFVWGVVIGAASINLLLFILALRQ